jgi:hypothetical protein
VSDNFLPRLVALLGFTLGIGLAYTTYTSPILSAGERGEIGGLIHAALGDPETPLPGPAAGMDLIPVDTASRPGVHEFNRATSVLPVPQPAAWMAAAARADSTALRGWLGAVVVRTSVIIGDTVYATYRRLSTSPGCPLLSHLRTTTVFSTQQLVQVTGDCPRLE